jgi:hypothetical protein
MTALFQYGVRNGLFAFYSKGISFTIGNREKEMQGYEITGKCTGCKVCKSVCPQNCIDFTVTPAVIKQENCLHCGNCLTACPKKAVMRKG